jgi:hypothetical protein
VSQTLQEEILLIAGNAEKRTDLSNIRSLMRLSLVPGSAPKASYADVVSLTSSSDLSVLS